MPPVRHHELPPTAGLPLAWSDLLPGPANLAATVAAQLDVPALQLECSGTAALLISLLTLRQQQPDRYRVVVPAFTCPLVAIAVQQAGLELHLCDLRHGHYDMDTDGLRAVCDEHTLAIIPTHLAGRVADVASAVDVAKSVGAHVIEDAAQALGARQAGISVGQLGDIGFFSLAAGKGLSIYEGGLLLARDPVLRAELAAMSARVVPRRIGWELRRSLELLAYAALYRPRGLRLAYGAPLRRALRRGDQVAAIGDEFPICIPLHRIGSWRNLVGTHAAARLPAFQHQVNTQAQRRLSRLLAISGVEVMVDPPDAVGSWPYFLLLLPDRRCRDAVLDHLWSAGMGVSRLFIHALPDYAYLSNTVPAGDVPNARDFAARSLTISNSPWVDDGDFATICAELEAAIV